MTRIIILTLALLAGTAHAALRPGTSTGPTMPVSPPTGGGSPTLTCVVAPVLCVQ